MLNITVFIHLLYPLLAMQSELQHTFTMMRDTSDLNGTVLNGGIVQALRKSLKCARGYSRRAASEVGVTPSCLGSRVLIKSAFSPTFLYVCFYYGVKRACYTFGCAIPQVLPYDAAHSANVGEDGHREGWVCGGCYLCAQPHKSRLDRVPQQAGPPDHRDT
jgi:hypothetical protein